MVDLDAIPGMDRHQCMFPPEHDFEILVSLTDTDIPYPRGRPAPRGKRPGFLHGLYFAFDGIVPGIADRYKRGKGDGDNSSGKTHQARLIET